MLAYKIYVQRQHLFSYPFYILVILIMYLECIIYIFYFKHTVIRSVGGVVNYG